MNRKEKRKQTNLKLKQRRGEVTLITLITSHEKGVSAIKSSINPGITFTALNDLSLPKIIQRP